MKTLVEWHRWGKVELFEDNFANISTTKLDRNWLSEMRDQRLIPSAITRHIWNISCK